jgi:beta-galactosidase
LITETNAGAIGGPSINFPAFDGQWRQAAWAFIARGAEMIEYWHWHTNHFGTETYWIGILPHDQQPGRVYHQLAELGAELATAGCAVVGLQPDAQIGLVYSSRSKWGLAFQSAFNNTDATFVSGRGDMDERSYQRIFEAYYRGTFDAGVSSRILHDDQLVAASGGLDPAAVVEDLPVLVVPGLLIADDELLTWLRSYAEAGGHLVLGIRTGYGDGEGRARTEVKPALLADAAGVSYQEFSNLNDPLAVTSVSDDLVVSANSHGTRWVDGLITDGAKVLAEYDHPHFGRFPAAVTTEHGAGRITTVGTLPDQSLARDLMHWLVPEARSGWELPESVTVSSATTGEGGRLHIVHNWSWDPQQIDPPVRVRDLLLPDGEPLEHVALEPWDVRVLLEI